jgi:hypothetical protein
MTQVLEQQIQRFETRWNQIHNKATSKKVKTDNSTRHVVDNEYYNATDWSLFPIDKIEMVGSVMVYPSIAHPGWWNVQSETRGVVVSFCGELAHRNAVQFAKRWSRDEEGV